MSTPSDEVPARVLNPVPPPTTPHSNLIFNTAHPGTPDSGPMTTPWLLQYMTSRTAIILRYCPSLPAGSNVPWLGYIMTFS